MPSNPSQILFLRHRRLCLSLLLLLLLVAVGLRFSGLFHEALSGDEMFSRRVVVESSMRGWQDVRQDLVHPPLYYILLKITTKLWGASALGIRMLSLLCGLLAIPVLVVLGNRLPGARWSGWLAAACVAVGRYDVFYSQEARSYAMYTLVVLLLALWMSDLSDAPRKTGYWILGNALMAVLVYTHYVGGVFVALVVFSVLLSRLSGAVKLRVFGCGLFALVLFLPWILGEISVYRAKNGIGENLDWQGHPGFYDLREVWAIALGVNNFRGATFIALLLLVTLCGAALVLLMRKGELRRSPLVIGLACMGWLAPLIVFVLSKPPINLPLFAIRHVLPATVLLTLLCVYGVELSVEQLAGSRISVLLGGSLCLLMLAAGPTLQQLHAGPSRLPYDQIAQQVALDGESSNVPVYAVWYYGVGDPINFYCQHTCVQKLPDTDAALPQHLILLYRPFSKDEALVYTRLLHEGYVEYRHIYFTDGMKDPYGIRVTKLDRP